MSTSASSPGAANGRSTRTPRPVILLEFNELTPALMDRFIADGHLPAFKALRDGSQVYVSDAEEAAPNLEPWIQWVTVHSGLSYDEHGIFHLGDGHKLEVKSLWDFASQAGHTVLVCGSMNVKYDRPINGAVIPDPWTVGVEPHPAEVKPYYYFVQRNVQEYTNDRVPLSKADVARFVQYMVTHGLSFATASAILKQLAGERTGSAHRWRRATILDKMQRDVFVHHLKALRPMFSTFFLNSTAHFQHMHWRNMDPEPFTVKPTSAEQAEYQDAILWGYQEMDRIVAGIMAAAPKDAVVILATALGQQPCLIYEDIGGKTFYRPRVFERLLEFVGIREWKAIEPVMSEQFHVRFETEAEAAEAARRLAALRVEEREVMLVEQRGTDVFTGCKIFDLLENHEVEMTGGEAGKVFPFFRLFYRVEGIKSGMHHPDGILWIRDPQRTPRTHADKVPLRDVAPTVLDYLGMDAPAYMSGRSLLRVERPSAVLPPRPQTEAPAPQLATATP
jgi:hypothetical protein